MTEKTAAPEKTADDDRGGDVLDPLARRAGFRWGRHESVEEQKRKGIWTYLGERFGHLEAQIRPFSESAVMIRREAAMQAIRIQLGLGEDQKLPPEKSMEVNIAAVTMALTGLRGVVHDCSPEMLATARRIGVEKIEGESVLFSGKERSEDVREFCAPMLEASTSFVTILLRAARGLQTVKDEEIAALGKGFVYGRHVKASWADSDEEAAEN